MTIKQQGGIFGRNPSYNEVTIVSGSISSDLLLGDTITPSYTETLTIVGVDATNNNPQNGIAFTDGSRNRQSVIRHYRGQGFGYGELAVELTTGSLGTLTEIARFNQNGLAFPDGQGIDFSATSGTGTSELFDDYEEGNFTATLTPETSGTVTIRSTEDLLSYTKIGRVVFVHGRLRIDSTSSPVGDYLTLSSLPFTSINGSESSGTSGSSSAFSTDGSDTFSSLPIYIPEGSSTAQVHGITLASINSNYRFDFSFSYIAA